MPTFFLTFPRPKNTVVKEPFLGKKFDECKSQDPYDGLDIFCGDFSQLSHLRVFRLQTGHGHIHPW
jgi:hypothetical protein